MDTPPPDHSSPADSSPQNPYAQPGYGSYGTPPTGYGYSGYGYGQPPAAAVKHAGVGIASFIVGLLAMLLVCGGFAAIIVLTLSDPTLPEQLDGFGESANHPPEVVAAAVVGCGMMVGGTIAFIGVILGMIGLFLPNRRRLWPILGVCTNGVLVLGVILLLLLGTLGG